LELVGFVTKNPISRRETGIYIIVAGGGGQDSNLGPLDCAPSSRRNSSVFPAG